MRRPERRLGAGVFLWRRWEICFWVVLLTACGLMAAVSITRTVLLSPDSFIYIDTAQNIVNGLGVSKSVLFAYEPTDLAAPELHVPNTTYAPLYPMLIAGLVALGVSGVNAALLISVAGMAAVLAAAYFLLRTWRDAAVAGFGTALLLFYAPLRTAGACAWSETTAVAFLLTAMLAALRAVRVDDCAWRKALTYAFLAGLAAGLAFAGRYALLCTAPFVVLMVADLRRPRPSCLRMGAAGIGFTVPAGAVLMHNYLASGRILGPARPPSTAGLAENTAALWRATTQAFLDPNLASPETQMLLLIALLTPVLGLLVLWRIRNRPDMALFAKGQYWIPLWAVYYAAFLIVYRSLYTFDEIGPRLALPGNIALVLTLAVLCAAAFRLPESALRIAALLLVLVAAGTALHQLAMLPKDNVPARITESERLSWIAEDTCDTDLIIGDLPLDIPVYCGPRHCLGFFPLEDPEQHLTEETLRAFLKRHRKSYGDVYIIVRHISYQEPGFEPIWERTCGAFITDLIFARRDYQGIWPAIRLKDACVFRVIPGRFIGAAGNTGVTAGPA